MKDDQEEKGKEDQHDRGEIVEARDTAKKFGKEKVRRKAENESCPGGK
jgi:hypothetical protein